MPEYDATHRDLILNWFDRSAGSSSRPTEFDPFVYLWFSFNAWASHESNHYEDAKMWRWFANHSLAKKTYSHLVDTDAEFLDKWRQLSMYSVKDMRDPQDRAKDVRVQGSKDLYSLMKVIYRIRCNLFHGEKSLDNPHDVELVTLAHKILFKLFEPFVQSISDQAPPSRD